MLQEKDPASKPTGQQLSKQQLKDKLRRTANGTRLDDEEWTDAQPTPRGKLTVTYVFRKENFIRKFGEEAEEEAREEEEDEDNNGDG